MRFLLVHGVWHGAGWERVAAAASGLFDRRHFETRRDHRTA